MQKLVLTENKDKNDNNVIYLKEEVIESVSLDTNLIKSLAFVITLIGKDKTLLVEANSEFNDIRHIYINDNIKYGLGMILTGEQILKLTKHYQLTDGSEKFLKFEKTK